MLGSKAHAGEDELAQEDWKRWRLFKHGFTAGRIRDVPDMQEVKSLEWNKMFVSKLKQELLMGQHKCTTNKHNET